MLSVRTALQRVNVSALCLTLIIAPVAFSLQGCSWFRKKNNKVQKGMVETPAEYAPAPTAPSPDAGVPPASAPTEGPRRPTGLRPAGEFLQVIYFDYDDASIRPDQLAKMEVNLKYMLENRESKVLVEGHCDERGTTEYNFALGERRARGVMEYFLKNGVTADRLQILSKGEEEPIDAGHGEDAWAKNRRCEFKFFD